MSGPATGGLRRGLVLAAVLGLGACIALPMGGGRDATGSEGKVGWKTVAEKREPNIVVAVDRSYCEVTRERFEETEEGERVLCHWRSS